MTDIQDQDGQQGSATPPAQRTEVSSLPPDVQDYIKRLNAENAARRKEVERLALEAQQRRDAELAEQQRWQELADERQKQLEQLTPYKAQVDELQAVISATLDAQLADLPSEVQQAVKDMPGDARAKLDWLAKNRALLARPAAPNYDAGPRGDTTPHNVRLTPMEEMIQQQSGLTRDQWIENKIKRERMEQTTDRGLLDRLRSMNSGE